MRCAALPEKPPQAQLVCTLGSPASAHVAPHNHPNSYADQTRQDSTFPVLQGKPAARAPTALSTQAFCQTAYGPQLQRLQQQLGNTLRPSPWVQKTPLQHPPLSPTLPATQCASRMCHPQTRGTEAGVLRAQARLQPVLAAKCPGTDQPSQIILEWHRSAARALDPLPEHAQHPAQLALLRAPSTEP